MSSQKYDESSIQVLEGLEAVRKRPGMYIGTTSERGLHHLVWEVVDNSVDEALAGHCDTITVTLRADGAVQVTDNGRGIPVGMHPKYGRPAAEVVMSVLHAGGKFDPNSYAVSGGLHGVGISVVNALSSRIEAAIRRDGHHWNLAFSAGGTQCEPLTQGPATDATGTDITFWADPTIFETTTYSWDTITTRLQQTAFLNAGLRITVTDERHDEPVTETYHYVNGITDFVTYLNRSKTVVHPSVITAGGTTDGMALDVAAQWTTAFTPGAIHSFANTISTHEGGTHEEGFRAALTGVINRYAIDKKYIKEDDRFSGDDIREGLTVVISIKLSEPQFEGQTKTKLGNSEAKGFTQRAFTTALTDWLDSHPAEAREIIAKAQSASQARVAATKARDMVRRKTTLGGASMPGKLADCTSTDPAKSEVYIVEGDSAGGSAKGGRDPQTQAIMPIRGKIINVEKARLDRALDNSEVEGIITALGTGIHTEFDITKARYHKVVLMADADVDGAHIQTLLLTLLFRFMRPLIEAGYVYLAQPPLYKIKWSTGDPDYVFSDAERDLAITTGQTAGRRLPKDGVQRFKGLGEMNAEELWATTMDPEHRVLLRVTVNDAARADNLFSLLMGDVVEPRRDYITEHATFAEIDV